MTPDHAARALARLNALSAADAEDWLLRVCGARAWAQAVSAARPFAAPDALRAAAEAAWDDLSPADWLEAFAAHPRIGESRTAAGGDASAWSRAEQSGFAASGGATRIRLAELQRAYERRFGHVYLVCAAGKSGGEMLEDCRARLAHDPETERAVAAAEERKIGRLRLERLLADRRDTAEEGGSG